MFGDQWNVSMFNAFENNPMFAGQWNFQCLMPLKVIQCLLANGIFNV
jgi:hypothetical protein